MRVILRRPLFSTRPSDVAAVIEQVGHGRILHQEGRNVLADVADGALESVKAALEGWGVYPQGPRIQVPDTRHKVVTR